MTTNENLGKAFVLRLIFATACLIVGYVLIHALLPDEWQDFASPSLKDSILVKPTGEVVLLDANAIRFVVGKERAKPILDRMQQQHDQVNLLIERERRLRQSMDSLWRTALGDGASVVQSPGNLIAEILYSVNCELNDDDCRTDEISCGDSRYSCLGSFNLWARVLEVLDENIEAFQGLDKNLIETAEELKLTYLELSRIKTDQDQSAAALKPSQIDPFFWVSPSGTMVEVFLFALFGVLTNLLVNSSHYLRTGTFRHQERWVAGTKLVYGPVLAVILVMAIMVGWFDLGDYESRSTTLPLIGFIFGYASRKTVNLFDTLTTRIMGKAAASVAAGPAAQAAKRLRFQQQFESMMRPRSLPEFRRLALDMVDDYAKTAKLARDERTS